MIQGTKEFESIDFFFNMTLDSDLRKEWQTLKAAVLAQQPTNSQSTPLCACGQPAVKVLCDNCFCDEVFASTKKRAYSTRATTGIPKLPPCSCCYAGKFCHVGIIPDTYMCYDAWRQLRAGV